MIKDVACKATCRSIRWRVDGWPACQARSLPHPIEDATAPPSRPVPAARSRMMVTVTVRVTGEAGYKGHTLHCC
ncbi:hypothetical protein E2C01_088826 [Portunus trituberculatus]|uniref:Uncharacterized protein n=1 Tax=Portunus trituberculatus TaxID=210409 RepID=A0A5B7JHI6_PORTR|nr:hypothetical protein [Portunus trituberculatus]